MSWWWRANSDEPSVLVLAAAFGLGPRVAADTLCKLLKLNLGPWTYASTRQPPEGRKFRLLFNFGVEDVTGLLTRADVRIWVDCLLWLRARLPESAEAYDFLLAERFFETRPEFLSLQPPVYEIQPLYEVKKVARHNIPKCYTLVSFGGVRTPYSTDAHLYGFPVLELRALVRSAMKFQRGDSILCCGPRDIVARLRHLPGLEMVGWDTPDRLGFLGYLAACSRYVVQPGLYGPFEAFEMEVDAVFSPPFSCTQVWQALAYAERSLLGRVPLLAGATAVIRETVFDSSNERLVFQRIDSWYRQLAGDSDIEQELDFWADAVFKGDVVSENLRKRRCEYVASCKALKKVDKVLAEIGVLP